MTEELTNPPARVKEAVLTKRKPDEHALAPVVDLNLWHALQGSALADSAEENTGDSLMGGIMLATAGGAGGFVLAEAVSVSLGITVSAGVEAVALAAFLRLGLGLRERSKRKREQAWLTAASRARLHEWLSAEWRVTATSQVFNEAETVIAIVNGKRPFKYKFTAENGKQYWIERQKEGFVTVLSDADAKEYAAREQQKRERDQRRTGAATPMRQRHTDLAPARLAVAKPVDPLTVFSRADRAKVEQAFKLVHDLVDGEALGTEQQFELERSQKVLDDAVALAGRLSRLSYTKKQAAFIDLMASVSATIGRLEALIAERDDAVVRDVEVLKNYTAALNPKNSRISLPE